MLAAVVDGVDTEAADNGGMDCGSGKEVAVKADAVGWDGEPEKLMVIAGRGGKGPDVMGGIAIWAAGSVMGGGGGAAGGGGVTECCVSGMVVMAKQDVTDQCVTYHFFSCVSNLWSCLAEARDVCSALVTREASHRPCYSSALASSANQ